MFEFTFSDTVFEYIVVTPQNFAFFELANFGKIYKNYFFTNQEWENYIFFQNWPRYADITPQNSSFCLCQIKKSSVSLLIGEKPVFLYFDKIGQISPKYFFLKYDHWSILKKIKFVEFCVIRLQKLAQ